ncbi:hypothetical protein HAX54_051546, partial [Datura stramonium]|nr:hypothetical protein [Datura stramonium]
ITRVLPISKGQLPYEDSLATWPVGSLNQATRYESPAHSSLCTPGQSLPAPPTLLGAYGFMPQNGHNPQLIHH